MEKINLFATIYCFIFLIVFIKTYETIKKKTDPVPNAQYSKSGAIGFTCVLALLGPLILAAYIFDIVLLRDWDEFYDEL